MSSVQALKTTPMQYKAAVHLLQLRLFQILLKALR
jgi:hypothetical protein